MPLQISVYAAIRIYEREKRCPICRACLKEFLCSAVVKSRQSMREPNELPSKAKFELLVDRAQKMSQGYSFSGFKELSEESKDALKTLSEFSRELEDRKNDLQQRAAAQARAHQMRAAAPVPAPPI